MKFLEEDKAQIRKKGLSLQQVEEQIEIFKKGNIPVNINAAANVGLGIKKYTEAQRKDLANYYDNKREELSIIKFVPASGAATRMFKALHNFLKEYDPGRESLHDFIKRADNKIITAFFTRIEELPFYFQAVEYARKNQDNFEGKEKEEQKFILLKTILFSPGLDLSNFPKGLVPFHNYKEVVTTAFEEHLYEAAEYASSNSNAHIHFTVSQDHKDKFVAEYEKIKSRVEHRTGVSFKVSFSFQDPKTDTIAVDINNDPFRTNEGELLFRPGGHGALIENFNDIKADVVFIKNIDNVVVLDQAAGIAEYKKMLAGHLLQIQEKCFSYLKALDSEKPDNAFFDEIGNFISNDLNASFATGFDQLSVEVQSKILRDRLNRPLRVCGMVKNEGEPGGGPFLVNMGDGTRSLQIIESAQIDENNLRQKEIAANATHFNPVDIVAGLKNYKGESFDLLKYVDPETSFIAEKSDGGRPLKALERPGLWNGAMAHWNTVFVEVPVSTFNPVKTATDLLKPTHQPV
ncbi:hypothetical protein BH23BAC2_BH23BAC2_04890 [soil metagenome]